VAISTTKYDFLCRKLCPIFYHRCIRSEQGNIVGRKYLKKFKKFFEPLEINALLGLPRLELRSVGKCSSAYVRINFFTITTIVPDSSERHPSQTTTSYRGRGGHRGRGGQPSKSRGRGQIGSRRPARKNMEK
jgi:hypothetical protein